MRGVGTELRMGLGMGGSVGVSQDGGWGIGALGRVKWGERGMQLSWLPGKEQQARACCFRTGVLREGGKEALLHGRVALALGLACMGEVWC